MKVIEPHIHMIARTTQDYERMVRMHTVACCEPAFWAGYDRTSSQAFFDYFTHISEFEPTRAAQYQIEHYCWICINPKEADDLVLSREVISFIPEFLHKPTVLGIASGVVAGLVGITPAAGFVNLTGALVIGLVAGLLGFFSVAILKHKVGYDDSLDAFGVHGMCGIWGALATGLFASPAINEATGLFYGNPGQLWPQFLSIVGTAVYSGIGTFVIIYITKFVTGGLRVDKESEIIGLDNAIHGERAFEMD